MSNRSDCSIVVIFGASGDLTRRKLLPAIYNLAEEGLLPDEFAILGIARPAIDQNAYRQQMREQVRSAEDEPLEADKWQRIEDRLYYISGEFDDPALYERLQQQLAEIGARHHAPPNLLFYFAIPPEMFAVVAGRLGEAGLTKEDEGWRRVVIEKPFGLDLASARMLNDELSHTLRESQIYRIDHYLGKETVQNILAFRFANGVFEPIWNRRYIDHVQMTVAEEVGVEQRGAYYETAGALRDIVQNHMLQLLALVAMEPPTSLGGENLRDEKVKVLRAIERLSAADVRRRVVRGQYEGYRQEPKVSAASRTETYVAMRLAVDNWRWAGVPFYLRTGKKLKTRLTEIAITFKRAPLMLFRDTPVQSLNPNVLCLRIQPDEGISLSFDAKAPGPFERLETVTMNFSYKEFFKSEPVTGYETLLFDAMSGDQTLFHRMDIVEAGWQAVMPVLDAWRDDAAPLPTYNPGTWGPADADVLIEQDGREWRL
jgi:glucose-6-phosphate 1-dehydrogenase